eukprot:10190405-Alexandrium_andersonii.AAC.1
MHASSSGPVSCPSHLPLPHHPQTAKDHTRAQSNVVPSEVPLAAPRTQAAAEERSPRCSRARV